MDLAWRRVPVKLRPGRRTRRVATLLVALALLTQLAPSWRADGAPRGDGDCP